MVIPQKSIIYSVKIRHGGFRDSTTSDFKSSSEQVTSKTPAIWPKQQNPVWVFTPKTYKGLSKKLLHNYHGPYRAAENLVQFIIGSALVVINQLAL